MEPLTPEAIIKRAIESGGGQAVFALLYSKETVDDIQKDSILYLTYAKDDEDAKRITEEHIKKAGKEDFLFQKLVGLASIPLTPNPIIEVLRELNSEVIKCVNPSHNHSKDVSMFKPTHGPLKEININPIDGTPTPELLPPTDDEIEALPQKYSLPPTREEHRQKIITSTMLLADRAGATKEELKLVDKLIRQFNKNFDAERPASSGNDIEGSRKESGLGKN